MECEELIYAGRWSRGYRKENEFIKELIYYEPVSAHREIKASQAAYAYGIKTPRYLYTSNVGSLRMHFEWETIIPIHNKTVSSIFPSILEIIETLQTIEWVENDHYWEKSLLNDFLNAFSYVEEERDECMSLIMNLEPTVFIHGDFSLQNIGLVNEALCVYDFQHGCLGPKNWDLHYLAATLSPSLCTQLRLSDREKRIICAIAAIKLGRAIRKNSHDIRIKQTIYRQWKDMINKH